MRQEFLDELYLAMREAHEVAVSKGWYEGYIKTDLEHHMLMVSEVAEASEEVRNNKPPLYQNAPAASMQSEHVVPYGDQWEAWSDSLKPEGEAAELADVILRVLDYAYAKDLPLEQAIKLKHEYNKTRTYKHGGKKL